MRSEKVLLCFGFPPFGNDRQPHAFCEEQDGADDCRVIIVNQHISYKGLIDFYPVQGKAFQIIE